MTAILADLRYALRQLRRSPGFAFAAVGTLALAIGASTALVSVLRATLLNPTPFPHVGQLVALEDTYRKDATFNGIMNPARTAELGDLKTAGGQHVFAALAFLYFDQPALSVGGRLPMAVDSAAVSGEFFPTLETKPLLGRVLTPRDDGAGAPETVVLSWGLWQKAFGGSPVVVGTTASVNGKPATVVGVMPREFGYPTGVALWKPAHISLNDSGYRGVGSRYLNVVARLSTGVQLADAERATGLLQQQLAHAYPATDADWGFKVEPLRARILGEYGPALRLLSAAVAMLLLIACANVAGLQLSRNAARADEIGIRRMLGIGSVRLLRQLLTESLLLFVLGGAGGVLLAGGLLKAFTAALPPVLLSFAEPRLDHATLGAMLAVTLLTGVLCGVAPALQFGYRKPRQGRTVITDTRRFGQGFASAQTALALVLLALASVLLGQLYRLTHTPLGFQSTQMLTVLAHIPFGTEPAKVHRFYTQLEDRFRAIPGVEAVGAINALPLQTFSVQHNADIVGRPPTPHRDAITAGGRTITPAYLDTMRIPLLAGRNFTPGDSEPKAPAVVLINRSCQQRYFPVENPVGKQLRNESGNVEIIGVVADTRGTGGALDAPVQPEVIQLEQGYWPEMHFLLRTPLPPAALDRALRAQAAALDSAVALSEIAPFTRSMDQVLAGPKLNSVLLAALAGLALVLVLSGVYGVVAFAAAQRTREVALRLALGAGRARIFRMLLRESALVAAPGLVFGFAGAWTALRLLPLPHTHTLLPLACAAGLLALAVTLAGILPARRAAAVDPMTALRAQ